MAKKKNKEETIVDVQEVYTKTELFVDRNRKGLTIVIGLGVLIAAIFAAYTYLYVRPQEEEAKQNIWKAQLYFSMDSVDWALNGDGIDPGFFEISEEYGSTRPGMLANYYIGLIYRDQGQYDEAITYFEESAGLSDEVFGIYSEANIGDCLAELEDYEGALSHYQKAAKRADASTASSQLAPMFLFKVGVVSMELEKFAEAKKSFQMIADNYEEVGSQIYIKARKYLGVLDQY
jgi:tetratricopeptide (TPR) repeat protein